MTGNGPFSVRPRRPYEPTRRAPHRPSALPDWMRNPEPEDLDIAPIESAGWFRRRWWAWQERRRLDQRFPVTFKVVAFFASWILALALVLGFYALYLLA